MWINKDNKDNDNDYVSILTTRSIIINNDPFWFRIIKINEDNEYNKDNENVMKIMKTMKIMKIMKI